MLDLYTAATPNGWKASIALEEMQFDYQLHLLDLAKRDQKDPDFLKINPNGRIPAIVDREDDNFAVFESGAILWYLAEKSGQLLSTNAKKRSETHQWLMFQMGGLGPMQGQAHVFTHYFPIDVPEVAERYLTESRRLYEVLDKRLEDREFLVDEYSIADIACWPWVRAHAWPGIDITGLDNLQRWMAVIEERPAVQRGLENPKPLEAEARLNEAIAMVAALNDEESR